jgi:hypothetical protein
LKTVAKQDRKAQLAEQLRANLRKRKQQERARGALIDDDKPDGDGITSRRGGISSLPERRDLPES